MSYHDSSVDKKLRSWFAQDFTQSFLKRIELREGNLRGLSQFDLALDYPIAAIAGRNGAGKSTLLAIACCAYHNNEKGFKLRRRRIAYYTFSDFFVQHTQEVPPQGIRICYYIAHDKWKKSPRFPDGKGVGMQSRWKRKGGKWNNYDSRLNRNVIFLGIDRIVPHSERSQSKSYSKAFREAELYGCEEEIMEAVGFVLGKKYKNLRYLEFSKYDLPIVEASGVKYSGLNMGAGENALFEIFRVVYSCKGGALLVIDEIELGLHVDAQKKLMIKLKEACLKQKIQIICTTHSKEIFDGLPPDARLFIEKVNNSTVLSPGISSEFAMAKMGTGNSEELEVMLEDDVASAILSFSLPANIRSRVRSIVVGSASALSRQLAAAYVRQEPKKILVVFDGDQRSLEKENYKYARSMVEVEKDDFRAWFSDHVVYLPESTWPESWLIQRNLSYVPTLAESLQIDDDELKGVMEYGLQAGKHKEFYEIAKYLGLDEKQCIQSFVMNIAKNSPNDFDEIVEKFKKSLQ